MKTNKSFITARSLGALAFLTLTLTMGIKAQAIGQETVQARGQATVQSTFFSVCPHSYIDPDCISDEEPHFIKHMKCVGANVTGLHQRFEVDLDSRGFDNGSGYYRPRNATMVDNYWGADLNCQGLRPEGLNCLGYLNGSQDNIIEVTTTFKAGKIYASYKTIKGIGPEAQNLECR